MSSSLVLLSPGGARPRKYKLPLSMVSASARVLFQWCLTRSLHQESVEALLSTVT